MKAPFSEAGTARQQIRYAFEDYQAWLEEQEP